ncbi:extracellular solute-binding protein [Pseudoteredinibacter isoporae]|uniref:extracellular solute-binding protein n=1 Tax=Pseudoteredinibacter isoporae TaxID=570281 RepID=UPI003107731D
MKAFDMKAKWAPSLALMAVAVAGCSQKNEGEQAVVKTAEAAPVAAAEAPVVTVYSSRKEHLIKPLFDKYRAETGVDVRYVTDKAGPLMERLSAEGESTPADMFMTVDAGNLWQASNKGLFAALDSASLEASVPAHLQAENNDWFGLSIRARTIVYSTERVNPEDLSTYEALAGDDWKGRLCLRTSKKVYNQSLVATMIRTLGEEKTEEIVKGWVANLATEPFSNDTKAMEAVAAGQCDATIVNTYYFGRLKKKNPDVALALFWPNQDDRGVHVNISGAGITKHAKQPEEAQKLLEWLASDKAQGQFAELNHEYPVNALVKPSETVQAWGEFKADLVNVEAAGKLQADAVKLMDRAGYR